jgi:hypothetical protein
MMKGLGKFAFKALVPKPLRNWISYGALRGRQRTMGPGASSPLPNARPVIDPTTGRPRQRNAHQGEVNGRGHSQAGMPRTPYMTDEVTYQRPQGNRFQRWWQERRLNRERRRANGSVRQGIDGGNATQRSRGLGRFRDMWLGEQYLPEERVDRRGRTYHQIRTRQGGVMRSDAQGNVRGQRVRTGGMRNAINNNRIVRRTRGFATLANMINFEDAGMDYQSSVGQRGHRRRSIRAGFRGFVNRSRRQGISAGGNSLASRMMSRRGEIPGLGGGRGGARAGGGLMNILKGSIKGLSKLGGTAGKGLLKGLGMVVKRGIPLLFKVGLRAIPILGEALLLWDAIKLVFTNWDAIKNAARTAWNWMKTTGVSLLGSAWSWIKAKAGEVWNGIKTLAGTVWNWIKTTATSLMSSFWNWIKGIASSVWNSISSTASSIWNGIKSTITGLMKGVWDWIKSTAQGVWDWIKSTASGVWDSIVSGAKTALANMFQPIKDAWDTAKSYVTNNPITQTIKQVVKKVTGGGKGKGARTGEWMVPRDNMPYNLHAGEMVLTRKEAQIMRSLVGSDNNSISKYLLDKASGHSDTELSIAKSNNKQSIKPTIRVTASEQGSPKVQQSGGNVTIKMEEGAVQIHVANASASEMKKATKQIYQELKRMMELDNMKNYRPARPKTR